MITVMITIHPWFLILSKKTEGAHKAVPPKKKELKAGRDDDAVPPKEADVKAGRNDNAVPSKKAEAKTGRNDNAVPPKKAEGGKFECCIRERLIQ